MEAGRRSEECSVRDFSPFWDVGSDGPGGTGGDASLAYETRLLAPRPSVLDFMQSFPRLPNTRPGSLMIDLSNRWTGSRFIPFVDRSFHEALRFKPANQQSIRWARTE